MPIDRYVASTINHDILGFYFTDETKKALVRPIYEKIDSQDEKNYEYLKRILRNLLEFHKWYIMLPII